MDEPIKSPIEMMGDLLTAMTTRAVEAERERDSAQKSMEEWFNLYLEKDKALKEAEASYAQEVSAHEITKNRLRELRHSLGGGDHI